MTQERAKILTDFFNADHERTKKIMAMDVNQAVAEINTFGHDFSADELSEFSNALKQSSTMSDADLENVAGGVGGGDMEENFWPLILIPLVIIPALTVPNW